MRNFSNRSDIEDKELIIMGDLNCDLLEEDNLIILRRILSTKRDSGCEKSTFNPVHCNLVQVFKPHPVVLLQLDIEEHRFQKN